VQVAPSRMPSVPMPSVLWHCWLGGRKGIRPVKKNGEDGGCEHWLVRMEWRPAGWPVCLPLLIFPCTIKSRSSLLAPAHPGEPGKRAVKRLWCLQCKEACAVVLLNGDCRWCWGGCQPAGFPLFWKKKIPGVFKEFSSPISEFSRYFRS